MLHLVKTQIEHRRVASGFLTHGDLYKTLRTQIFFRRWKVSTLNFDQYVQLRHLLSKVRGSRATPPTSLLITHQSIKVKESNKRKLPRGVRTSHTQFKTGKKRRKKQTCFYWSLLMLDRPDL